MKDIFQCLPYSNQNYYLCYKLIVSFLLDFYLNKLLEHKTNDKDPRWKINGQKISFKVS